MARVVRIELTESARDCLQAIFKKGTDWRERDRAKTILLLASGHRIQEVAEQQNLCLEAVRNRRRKMKYQWLPFKTFTDIELELAIDNIGDGLGYKYQLTFC